MENRYEVPDEAYDDYERPKRQSRKRRRAFAICRVPWCKTPIKVFDDEDPDEKIEEFVADGHCWWLEANDPVLAQQLRNRHFARLEEREKPSRRYLKR